MRDNPSQSAASAGTRPWLCALGAALAWGCATGVEVTDGELAAICSEPGISCGPAGPSAGSGGASAPPASVGGTGTGGSGTGAGMSGAGFGVGAGGTAASPVGTGGSGIGGAANGGSVGAGAGLPPGECLAASDVVILYRDRREGVLSTNEPSMVLSLENAGAPFDLSQLTIRYWFTADGGSNFTGNIDYSTLDGQQGLGGVQVSFGQDLGSDYAELSFGGGSVQAGIQEVQLRFHADGYPTLDQTNDFSFLPGASQLTPNPNITAYLNGSQIGGCVPSF